MLSQWLVHLIVLLDLIKAFDRVSHLWLVRKAKRLQYPLLILRLSIAAYRMPRVIAVAVPHVELTLFVDDSSIEASGTPKIVERAVVEAARVFTSDLQDLDMDFSDTKNMCLASHPSVADRVVARLPGLGIKRVKAAKSLGGALGGGKRRHTKVLQKRLHNFRARKPRFQKLRRMRGAACVNRVLATGGTAAMVYGEGNIGVANTMLYHQRVATAAASVPSGAGDLNVTLILVDGPGDSHTDPAFHAHEEPIVKWAEAVWESWLPMTMLAAIADNAVAALGVDVLWRKVTGPGLAMVASALRLGWQVLSCARLRTDLGDTLDLQRDSPAMVRHMVRGAVRRWRWKKVEERHPCIRQGDGGHGAFVQPLFQLLKPKDLEEWGPAQRGALRSAVTDRQWTQHRLWKCGKVSSPNCRLCVLAGFVDDGADDPRFHGTILHRVLTCPVLAPYRDKWAPQWILRVAARVAARPDVSLDPALFLLLTRGLMPTPAAVIQKQPPDSTFEWVKPPPAMDPGPCTVYVDGSRLFADRSTFGLTARHGWAFVAVDCTGNRVAEANGSPPHWASGIFGAELWGLHEATATSSDLEDHFRVDCQAVQRGAGFGGAWAAAPGRRLARAWIPIASRIEGDASRVSWMPAHSTEKTRANKVRSDGRQLSSVDMLTNARADELAKAVPRAHRPPRADVWRIRNNAGRLYDAALWLGRVTALANHLPDLGGAVDARGRIRHVRDSQGLASAVRRRPEHPAPAAPSAPTPASTARTPVRLTAPATSARTCSEWPAAIRAHSAETASSSTCARLARVRDQDADRSRLLDWLDSRPAGRPPLVPATSRMAAIRRRLETRTEAREGPVPCSSCLGD